MPPSVRSLLQLFMPIGIPSSNFAVEVVVAECVMTIVFPDSSDPVLGVFLGLWVIAVFPIPQDVISVEICAMPSLATIAFLAALAFK